MRREPEEMIDTDREISLLIRAKFGILSINTFEELRVLQQLERIREDIVEKRLQELAARAGTADLDAARKRMEGDHHILRWTITGGLVHRSHYVLDPKGRSVHAPRPFDLADVDTHNPIQLMKHLRTPPEKLVEGVNLRSAIFVFCDLHHWLDREDRSGRFNHQLVRALKDIAQSQRLRKVPGCVILLSPRPVIPPELVKEIQLVDYPLPTLEQLDKAFQDEIPEMEERYTTGCVALEAEGRRMLMQALCGLTYEEAENVVAKALVNGHGIVPGDIAMALKEKQQIIRKDGTLEYFESQVGLEDVGGLERLTAWLKVRRRAFGGEKLSYMGQEIELPEPRGVLLIGVPGGGKSLVCKAIASDWRLPLLRMDIGRIFGRYVGESEENIRRAIKVAESVSPAILWLDEIEKAFPKTTGAGDSGAALRVLNAFLTWLQEKHAAVFVVATGNDIEQIPAELTRKGRFDEIFYVGLPDAKARLRILKIHTRKFQFADDDYAKLVARSKRFTGAEIEQAISNAWYALPALLEAGAANQPAGPDEPESPLARAVFHGMRAMVPLANRKNAKGDDLLLAETLRRARVMAVPASDSFEDLLDTQSSAAQTEFREEWGGGRFS
jgi:hypothetical protein